MVSLWIAKFGVETIGLLLITCKNYIAKKISRQDSWKLDCHIRRVKQRIMILRIGTSNIKSIALK